MKNKVLRLVFILPFLITLVLFWLYPLASSFYISLTDWDYLSPTYNFVGIDNYTYILADLDFFDVLFNTLFFSLGTILANLVIGLALALFFREKFRGSKAYQLIIFSPWITPTVAVALVWSWIYDPDRGFANHILQSFGCEPLQWLHSSSTAMLGVVIFSIWKTVGYNMLFYLGALEKVSTTAYEAATIDGAGAWRKFFHVTLPLISPTTFFLFLVNLISAIQVYDQIQIMTQGGPGRSTTTLLYLYYEKAFQNFRMGEANAVAMIILLVILGLSVASTFISRRHVHYE